MKRKVCDFGSYKKMMKLSYNEFNRWITSFYDAAYKDALDDLEAEKANEEPEEAIFKELSDEDLLSILLSVKGIGEKRARTAVERIMEYEGN